MDYRSVKLSKQRGGILIFALAAIATLSVLSVIGSSLYSTLISGTQRSSLNIGTAQILTQTAYTLNTETQDSDSDGYPEATAGSVVNGDGWNVPATSGAPKNDAWGTALKYCAWDNGAINSSAGRLTGDNPALQSSAVFAVISAGPNKVFDTSCAQARANAVQGDDGYRLKSISEVLQGVGGTVYYGDPMAKANLPTSGNKLGVQRTDPNTQINYQWNGTAWVPPVPVAGMTITASADCSAYGSGAMARDSAGDLYICK